MAVRSFSSNCNIARCGGHKLKGSMCNLRNGPRELSGNPNMLILKSTPFPSGLDVPATYPRIALFVESGKIAW